MNENWKKLKNWVKTGKYGENRKFNKVEKVENEKCANIEKSSKMTIIEKKLKMYEH